MLHGAYVVATVSFETSMGKPVQPLSGEALSGRLPENLRSKR